MIWPNRAFVSAWVKNNTIDEIPLIIDKTEAILRRMTSPKTMKSSSIKRVCVYCGSSPGSQEAYTAAARELGKLLAENHIELVYGGASIGVMGAVANAVMENGGRVTGIIPHGLFQREVAP